MLKCSVKIDSDRLAYAHTEYLQGIKKFSMYLQSGDPDHYKRSGALLHSLYLSKPIVELIFDPAIEDVDTLITDIGVSHSEAEDSLSFGQFFEGFHNEFTAFSLAFDICRQYERDPIKINPDYVHNVCAYLKNNGNLSVESLFMMFKSLFT